MTNGPVQVSEEIPELPPPDPEKREQLEWTMLRENYRIAMTYDRLSRRAKLVVIVLLWITGAVTGLVALWDTIKHLAVGSR